MAWSTNRSTVQHRINEVEHNGLLGGGKRGLVAAMHLFSPNKNSVSFPYPEIPLQLSYLVNATNEHLSVKLRDLWGSLDLFKKYKAFIR